MKSVAWLPGRAKGDGQRTVYGVAVHLAVIMARHDAVITYQARQAV